MVAYARELEAEDASLAEAMAVVDGLHYEARELHERAAHVEEFLARLPAERAAAVDAVDEAAAELAQREEEARRAEEDPARVEGSRKEEAVLAARRAAVRTRDAAASAERKLVRAREALAGFEQKAAAAEAELAVLDGCARNLADRLHGVPRVAVPEPDSTVGWAARVETALFVARSGLETERERIVRQANELAAGALGEPLFATSASLVRERLEARPQHDLDQRP